MIRKIIHIDREKCNGCGACASACHEGAIEMINGKAVLTRDDYCDGFGDCLPACPTGAISFETREAAPYDAAAVAAKSAAKAGLPSTPHEPTPSGCPGRAMHQFRREDSIRPSDGAIPHSAGASQLRQWPCQIRLVPASAPFFEEADLLIAADCTAYAYAEMHEDFMKGRITLIGCPKLDEADYTEKLTAILRSNSIRSVTVLRMEVPCCGGLERAVRNALDQSGKLLPYQCVTFSLQGEILGRT